MDTLAWMRLTDGVLLTVCLVIGVWALARIVRGRGEREAREAGGVSEPFAPGSGESPDPARFCPWCGHEARLGGAICPDCGGMLRPVPRDEWLGEITAEEEEGLRRAQPGPMERAAPGRQARARERVPVRPRRGDDDRAGGGFWRQCREKPEADPARMPALPPQQWTVVHHPQGDIEAQAIKDLLESAGIPAVTRVNRTIAYNVHIMQREGWGSLFVPESQAATARELIEAFLQEGAMVAGEEKDLERPQEASVSDASDRPKSDESP